MKDYDGFPNAPGLSKKLGLKQAEKLPQETIGWGPWKREWYSVCSAHGKPRANCPRCMVGSYNYTWVLFISHIVYKIFPRFWRWWVNR